MSDALRSLANRVRLTVGRGVIDHVGDGAKVQTMQVRFLAGEVRADMERFQQYGFTSVPLAGQEVIALFSGGDRSNGVVVAVGDRSYRMKGLKDGEVALYDDLGQSVHLTRDGIVIKGAGRPMLITDTPKLRIEADLEVTGEVKDRADADGRTMEAMRETFNAHTHPEPDGGTGTPTQTM